VTATPVLDERLITGRHRVGAAPARSTVRRLAGEQVAVVGGQGLAGVGNMAFSLVAAHQLPKPVFAQLATFLALYLLLLVPSSGFAAAAAAAPESAVRGRRVLVGSVVAGAGIAFAGAPLGHALGLSIWLVVLLGLGLPAVTMLSIVRGRLYGRHRRGVAVSTLLTEPVVRLVAGTPLLALGGATGAGFAVVGGGYAALLVGVLGGGGVRAALRRPAAADAEETSAAQHGTTIATFIALTLLQNVDIILANRLLESGAGTFAAVSTLGGISAFATATIPLVLLARARPGSSESNRATVVAFAAAAALGVTAVLVAALAPTSAYATVLGPRYAHIGHIAVPYLAAMALFGVARVGAARMSTHGMGRTVATLCSLAVAGQMGWIVSRAQTPAGVALGTEIAITTLAAALLVTQLAHTLVGARTARLTVTSPVPPVESHAPVATAPPHIPDAPEGPSARTTWRDRRPSREFWLVTGLMGLALLLRMLIARGLWVDEATSVTQAQMSYGGMLHDLRTTDVHPPGYFTILWGWVRAFGDGPLSVRMPSIIFGVLLIPAVYATARELFDRRTARIAAVLSVLAPQAVWYSQEARMYALFMLLVMLAVWAQARAMRTGGLRAWAAYTLVTAALVYTQYFTVLVIAAQQLVFIAVFIHRRHRSGVGRQVLLWLGSCALIALAALPLVPFAMQQFAVNQAAGRGFGAPSNTGVSSAISGTHPSAYSLIANLVWLTLGYHSDAAMTMLGAMWPLAMLLVLALLGRGRSPQSLMLLVIAVLPVLALFVVGQEKSFLFDLRYFIGAVPLVVILAARAAASWPLGRAGASVMCVVLAAALGGGLYDQQLNGQNPRRYDFEPAMAQVAKSYHNGDVVVLSPSYLYDVSHYYQRNLDYKSDVGTPQDVAQHSKNAGHVFVVGSFFTNGNQKQHVRQLLRALSVHRHVEHRWTYDNVKVWELS
jgi:hypothetical protein